MSGTFCEERRSYVYVEYPTDEQELYDLDKDPYQLENIVAKAEPRLVEELTTRLQELAACSGEECRAIEDRAFGYATAASAPTAAPMKWTTPGTEGYRA